MSSQKGKKVITLKNLLLGFSVAANLALAYMLFQDDAQMAEIKSKLENLGEQAEGKAKQVKGALTGDTGDKLSGNLEEGKGKLKDTLSSAADELS
ncbi:CsbD family protein [Furfurilactobacillus siliginis]|uniref:CsbD family protein n=1 Tax=Furfurilactobacillus siliginis TaxID=348151 RepID=UPI001ED99F6D|nr:CsbD family protein [Furfurilactobacillus siliginis]